MGGDALQLDGHLGDGVLDHRVVGQGPAAEGDRRPLLGPGDRQLQGPLGQAEVDAGERGLRPGEDAEHEGSAPASPAGTTRAMYGSGMTAPSITVSSLRVARMPRVSQVSTMW